MRVSSLLSPLSPPLPSFIPFLLTSSFLPPALLTPLSIDIRALPFPLSPSHITRYVDYPVPDILEMIGRANRPLVDESGKSVNELLLTS